MKYPKLELLLRQTQFFLVYYEEKNTAESLESVNHIILLNKCNCPKLCKVILLKEFIPFLCKAISQNVIL